MILSVVIGLIFLISPQFGYICGILFKDYQKTDEYINFYFTALTTGGFLIFTPFITVLPCVISFCDEYNSGYMRLILIRTSRKKYLIKRSFSNAVTGGAATALPMLIFWFITLICANPYIPGIRGEYSSPLDHTFLAPLLKLGGGNVVILILIALGFLFGVVWSTIGLCFATIFPNRYVALCCPFILFYTIHVICGMFDAYTLSPVNTILPDILPSWGYLFIYQAVLLLLALLFYFIGAQRRLKDV